MKNLLYAAIGLTILTILAIVNHSIQHKQESNLTHNEIVQEVTLGLRPTVIECYQDGIKKRLGDSVVVNIGDPGIQLVKSSTIGHDSRRWDYEWSTNGYITVKNKMGRLKRLYAEMTIFTSGVDCRKYEFKDWRLIE